MNSLFAKKDILSILLDVSQDINIDYNKLVESFNKCQTKLIVKLGVPITSEINEELKGCTCSEDGCNKKVAKPIPINGLVFCSVHLKKKIKEAKKNRSQCQHVFTENSEKRGQQCTGQVIENSDFCKRHQKKLKCSKLQRNSSTGSNCSSCDDSDEVSMRHFDNSLISIALSDISSSSCASTPKENTFESESINSLELATAFAHKFCEVSPIKNDTISCIKVECDQLIEELNQHLEFNNITLKDLELESDDYETNDLLALTSNGKCVFNMFLKCCAANDKDSQGLEQAFEKHYSEKMQNFILNFVRKTISSF